MVQNSLKHLLKCSQIIKELLATFLCNIVKLKFKTVPSLAISHTKESKNCAMTNVPTIALLIIPQKVWV